MEERVVEEYVRGVAKNTEIFSTFSPDDLLDTVVDLAEKKGYKYTVAGGKYKIKFEILEEDGEKVELTAKISRVDKDKNCVEFTRTGGNYLAFYNKFELIKEFFGDIVNASY